MPFLSRPLNAVGYSRPQYGEAPSAPHAVDEVFAMQLPSDPEAASMMSLDYIHQLVRDGRADPVVRRQAFRILQQAGVAERDYTGIIRAIHQWVQRHVYYMHDPSGVELLTQARVLLAQIAQGEAVEDCDSFVLLEQSLLQSVGIPSRSVIWKADPRDPTQWSHITLEAHDGQRWVPLDPIMKNKPVGWEPPKHYGKKVVPVGDGPSFPAKTRGTGRSVWQVDRPQTQLPQSVGMFPRRQAQTTARTWFAGASNLITWSGYRGYGADAAPPIGAVGVAIGDAQAPSAVCRTRSDLQYVATRWVVALLQAYALPPTAESADTYVGRVWGALRVNLTPYDISAGATRLLGTETVTHSAESYLAYELLGAVAANLRRLPGNAPHVAELVDAERAAFLACARGRATAAVAQQAAQVAPRALARLRSEVRDLRDMQTEALATIDRVLPLISHYTDLAERHVGRLEDRQAFLQQVDQGAQVVSTALSLAGEATGGITEILAIAVVLGNYAYQTKQAARMASGASAQTLGELASALGQIEDTLLGAETVYADAGAALRQRQGVLTHLEMTAPTLIVQAEAQERRDWLAPVAVASAAAAAVLLWGVLA